MQLYISTWCITSSYVYPLQIWSHVRYGHAPAQPVAPLLVERFHQVEGSEDHVKVLPSVKECRKGSRKRSFRCAAGRVM